MSSIEELRNLDLKSSNPDIVRRILNEFAILCVPFYIKKGVYILRARKRLIETVVEEIKFDDLTFGEITFEEIDLGADILSEIEEISKSKK